MLELQGIADGAAAQGCQACGSYIIRAVVLANAPGDVQDFVFILLREMYPNLNATLPPRVKDAGIGPSKHGLQW